MDGGLAGASASRRVVLTLSLGGLLTWPLSACDDSRPPGSSPPRARSTDDPQRALVQNTADRIFGVRSIVRQMVAAHPELARGALRGFERVHNSQLARLRLQAGDVRSLPFPKGWRRNPTMAAEFARDAEKAVAAELADSAQDADSGALAGLIAQLAAGIDMQLAATAEVPIPLAVEPEVPHAAPTMQVDAMQKTLADEHAAVYLYGVLGAHTSASGSPALFAAVDAAYAAHRARRDRLTALVQDAGEDPVVAEPGYEIPAALGTDRQVASAGLRLERGAAARYLWLVENSADDLRQLAVAALRNTAVRELSLRGSPEIFPGVL